MNRIKVAQFGLGPIGFEALKLAAEQPWLEIVGAVDNDPAKAGRSLAEFPGLAALDGLTVWPSLEGLFRDVQPDVILHTASSSAVATLAQMRPALEFGVNVASTCEELIYPALRHPELARECNALCLHTGARLVATGVNPGFAMDLLPICLTGACRFVDSIQVERVVDAATRRRPLQAKIGCGQERAAFQAKLDAGAAGHAGLRESLALLGHALAWTFDTITEKAEAVVADRPIQTAHFLVQPGQVCGIRQRAAGLCGDAEKIVLDLKMYLGAADPHDTVVVVGDPPLRVTAAGGIAGDSATVAALVNAVPRLMAAPAGLRLLHELAVPVWRGTHAN